MFSLGPRESDSYLFREHLHDRFHRAHPPEFIMAFTESRALVTREEYPGLRCQSSPDKRSRRHSSDHTRQRGPPVANLSNPTVPSITNKSTKLT